MLRAVFGRTAAQATSAAIKTPYNNPYKAQKQWPPDFTRIDSKHQFRLERRYRRRAKLAYARPQWMKYTKLFQWGICSCMHDIRVTRYRRFADVELPVVLVYSVLFMDWGDVPSPFPRVCGSLLYVFGPLRHFTNWRPVPRMALGTRRLHLDHEHFAASISKS